MTDVCPTCELAGLRTVYTFGEAPVHSVVLLDSREEALSFPTGAIRLGYCNRCGFITNQAYDSEVQDYSSRYESTQSFSPTFTRFNRDLAARLIEKYDLHGKEILEIGCGQGEFLTLMCDMGNNRGTGFDPAYTGPEFVAKQGYEIRYVPDYFSAAYTGQAADFVCCKMTLEHIPNTREFVAMVRAAIDPGRDPVIFFQVPDTLRILQEIAFWDIYYEHCSYFTAPSLAYLFRSLGFEILSLTSEYAGQYLLVEARLGPGTEANHAPHPAEGTLEAVEEATARFAEHVVARIEAWQRLVEERAQGPRPAVIWGGGSKGVAFLTTLGIKDSIQYAVDINPRKKDTFLAGSGQRIVLPEFLAEYQPATIFVMNPVYVGEIQVTLDQLGVRSELIPLV